MTATLVRIGGSKNIRQTGLTRGAGLPVFRPYPDIITLSRLNFLPSVTTPCGESGVKNVSLHNAPCLSREKGHVRPFLLSWIIRPQSYGAAHWAKKGYCHALLQTAKK